MVENYIATRNPFNLAGPPQWFLTQLAMRDPDLVILPGLSEPVYRVARRTKKSFGLMHAAMGNDSETGRMIQLRVVPVTSILPMTAWHEFFQWLDDHDVWKVGGSAQADAIITEQDAVKAAQLKRRQDDEAMARGTSGYHALKMRGGERLFVSTSPGMAESPAHPGTA